MKNPFTKPKPDVAALRHVSLYRGQTPRDLAPLAANADVIELPAGAVLTAAGQRARQFIAVVDGRVDITGQDGGTVAGGPGTELGGDELVSGDVHPATATASTPTTVVVISGPAFRWSVRALPGVAERLRHFRAERHGGAS